MLDVPEIEVGDGERSCSSMSEVGGGFKGGDCWKDGFLTTDRPTFENNNFSKEVSEQRSPCM